MGLAPVTLSFVRCEFCIVGFFVVTPQWEFDSVRLNACHVYPKGKNVYPSPRVSVCNFNVILITHGIRSPGRSFYQNMMAPSISVRILNYIFIISSLLSIRLTQVFLFFQTNFVFVDERSFHIDLNILYTVRCTINCVFVEFARRRKRTRKDCCESDIILSVAIDMSVYVCDQSQFHISIYAAFVFVLLYINPLAYIYQSIMSISVFHEHFFMPPRAIQAHLFHPYIVRMIPSINSDSFRNRATESSTQDTHNHNMFPEPSVRVSPYDSIELVKK